jgi:hypothetical protein
MFIFIDFNAISLGNWNLKSYLQNKSFSDATQRTNIGNANVT